MDQLIKENLRDFNIVHAITLLELMLSLVLSTALSLFLAKVYSRTHSGMSYSKSFVQTLVLFAVTVSLIMLLIGSNIARAFSLVGALSIIRFRNPIKDPRDVAFLFAAMAIGMACGTKFYLFGTLFTLFISAVSIGLYATDFGELSTPVHVLKVRMRQDQRPRVEQAWADLCQRCTVIAVDRLASQDGMEEVIYELTMKRRVRYEDLIKRLNEVSGEISVNLLLGDGYVSV